MLEKHIGKALADVRNAKGLTQREVGESLGKHFSWVSGLENGKKTLDLPMLQELCGILDVSLIDVADRAYFGFRDEITEFLRETEARLPDDQGSAGDVESRISQFMQDGAVLLQDAFRLLQQPSRLESLRNRFAADRPQDPHSPRRRGRPPAPVNPTSKKGSPAGKKR